MNVLQRNEQFLWEDDEIEEYGESELALQDGAASGEDQGAPGEHDEAQMGPTEEEQELDSKQQMLRDQVNAGEDIVALEAECEQLEMALLGKEETQAKDLSLDEQLAGVNPVVDLAKRALDWVPAPQHCTAMTQCYTATSLYSTMLPTVTAGMTKCPELISQSSCTRHKEARLLSCLTTQRATLTQQFCVRCIDVTSQITPNDSSSD